MKKSALPWNDRVRSRSVKIPALNREGRLKVASGLANLCFWGALQPGCRFLDLRRANSLIPWVAGADLQIRMFQGYLKRHAFRLVRKHTLHAGSLPHRSQQS